MAIIKCIHKECPHRGQELKCYDGDCEGYETTEPIPDPKWVKRKLNPGKYDEEHNIRIMKEKGIPSRFLLAKKEDFPDFEFEHPPTSQYIWGTTGIGKTRLLAAIIHEMITYRRQRPEFEFIIATELLHKIRQSFDKKTEESEFDLVDLYSKVDCLFLDDLGAENSSNWSLQTLYLILNSRYNEELTTIITSNFPLNELIHHVGDRIVSRIVGMCEIVNSKGKNRRIY